jgi:nitrate/nitrite-specific signal transduction histidine kinase
VRQLGLNDEQEIQVFHIVQEALANTAKHSMARHAWSFHRQVTPMGWSFVLRTMAWACTCALGFDDCRHGQGNDKFQAILGLEIMRSRAQTPGWQH